MTHDHVALVPEMLRIDIRTLPKRSNRGLSIDYPLGEGVDYVFMNLRSGAVYSRTGMYLGSTSFRPIEAWQERERQLDVARQTVFAELAPQDRNLGGQSFDEFGAFSKYALYLMLSIDAYDASRMPVPAQLSADSEHADQVILNVEQEADIRLDRQLLAQHRLFEFVDRLGTVRVVPGVLHAKPSGVLTTQLPPSLRSTDLSAGR